MFRRIPISFMFVIHCAHIGGAPPGMIERRTFIWSTPRLCPRFNRKDVEGPGPATRKEKQ